MGLNYTEKITRISPDGVSWIACDHDSRGCCMWSSISSWTQYSFNWRGARLKKFEPKSNCCSLKTTACCMVIAKRLCRNWSPLFQCFVSLDCKGSSLEVSKQSIMQNWFRQQILTKADLLPFQQPKMHCCKQRHRFGYQSIEKFQEDFVSMSSCKVEVRLYRNMWNNG